LALAEDWDNFEWDEDNSDDSDSDEVGIGMLHGVVQIELQDSILNHCDE